MEAQGIAPHHAECLFGVEVADDGSKSILHHANQTKHIPIAHFAHDSILCRMMRWLVTLKGAEEDLAQLVEWPDGADWRIIRHEKRGVVLCGQKLEAEDSYEVVGQIADAQIAQIDRSARYQLSHYQGVRRNQIVEQRQERDHVIMSVGLAEGKSTAFGVSWVKSAPDGTVIETSEDRAREERASSFVHLVRLQEAHPDLADALRYLDEEPTMYGFYKAVEAIGCAVSRQNKSGALVQLGWTSRKKLQHFKWSAQPKRHHKCSGPPKPMTEYEAERYVQNLLEKLIAHLDSTTP